MFTRIKERFNKTKKWYSSKITKKNRILLGHRTKGPALEYYDGTKHWLKFGYTHRDHDLPAVEFSNGDKEWWVDGKRHRDYDLPAVIKKGFKEYWFKGEKHRENDLPAVEYKDGRNEYFLNNKKVTPKRPPQEIVKTKYHTKYYQNGFLHNEKEPAVIYSNGDKEYWKNGLLCGNFGQIYHEDINSVGFSFGVRPAIFRKDGSAEWLIDGIYVNSEWNSIDKNGKKYKYSGTYKNRKVISQDFPIGKIDSYLISIYKK